MRPKGSDENGARATRKSRDNPTEKGELRPLVDRKVAHSRRTGGEDRPDMPDRHSTTGTTPSDEFVGRVSGTDVGYTGETGAERRAAVKERAEDDGPSPPAGEPKG